MLYNRHQTVALRETSIIEMLSDVNSDNQIPPQPKDADGARIWQRLKDFVDDTTLTRFDFPADSTSKERKIAHPLADAFGLVSRIEHTTSHHHRDSRSVALQSRE